MQQGPASWLDTNLTNPEMVSFFPNAGQGQKITARFKSKVFSFGHILVADNKLTLFQISEPLRSTSSATPTKPAPFGTDINGNPLSDPIPDTMVDPATGLVVSPPATGTPALLDKWTITKPEVRSGLSVKLTASGEAQAAGGLTFTVHLDNASQISLNGSQARLHLSKGLNFAGAPGDKITVQGNDAVVTVGRLAAGTTQDVTIPLTVSGGGDGELGGIAELTSSTARPVSSNFLSLQ